MSDLKFDKVWFKMADFEPAKGIKSAHLREVAQTFQDNMLRVHSLIGFIPRMVGIAMRHQLAADIAAFDSVKHVPLTDDERADKALMAKIKDIQRAIVDELEAVEAPDQQAIAKFIRESAANTMRIFQRYDYNDSKELSSILVHMAYGTWTAFEVFTADLWIAALNFGPKTLAESVFTKPLKDPGDGETAKEARKLEKTMPVSVLKDYDYDLRLKMGDLLNNERKVKFDSFTNTILAYAAVFGKEIDDVLLNKKHADCANIGFLEALRNLYIHNNGRVDDRFREKLHFLESSPFHRFASMPDGVILDVDGEMIKQLAESTIKVSTHLLKFVDSKMGDAILEYEI